MAKISLIVNGNPVNANVDPRTLLVQFLRENLRLTGTHVGCDTSQCGACVVHVDGKAVKSCTTLAVMADGHDVKTIEGLAADGAPLHPMQEAFRQNHGLQCGFCTPGMIMTAIDIVHRKGHDLDDHTIREELDGIEMKGRSLVIGATAKHADVAASAIVGEAIPALAELAGLIGDPAVRHKGTIGGSLANNDPTADYPAACMALGANIITNKRRLKPEEFFQGLFTTALEPDEIITRVMF